jgi:divalent metal cation (Fe/Co/Zn/Cd) transporter
VSETARTDWTQHAEQVLAAAVLIGMAANAAVGAWWLDPVIAVLSRSSR